MSFSGKIKEPDFIMNMLEMAFKYLIFIFSGN